MTRILALLLGAALFCACAAGHPVARWDGHVWGHGAWISDDDVEQLNAASSGP